MKIEFLKSPTGRFLLAYFAGDVADVQHPLAEILCKEGYARPVQDEKMVETAVSPQAKQAEKRVRWAGGK